jgi:asparagine synthase (glutamine-hydrolysing)
MIIDPYFAFIRDPDTRFSPRLSAAISEDLQKRGLTILLKTSRMCFVGHPSSRHLKPVGGTSLIWGSLFDRRSTRFQIRLHDVELQAPTERFVTQFWGGYLALREQADSVEIFRDPSGMIPAYVTRVDGVDVVTSSPGALVSLGLVSPSIDFTILTQALAFRDLRPARTALRGISELHPGTAIEFGGDTPRTRQIWSPWTFTQQELEISDRAHAVKAVREAVLQATRSWAGTCSRPIVELSGGLDSSIVTASLAHAGAAPTCATFVPLPGDSDERHYARAVAEHHGLRIEELEIDVARVDVTASDSSRLPWPCARSFAQALDRPLQRLAGSIGADMFLSGGGGDNVFCHLQSTLPILDAIKRHGLGMQAARTTMDVAEVADITFWEAARSALGRRLEGDRLLPKPRINRFLAQSTLADLPWPAGNPWIEADRQSLVGKRRHVWTLLGILNHMEGFGRQAIGPICSPLLSQPVVETCLRIPTWLWFERGQNRSVAREAFCDLLPRAVVGRQSKAAFDSLGASVIRSNMGVLRGMLLDGLLVREGIADAASVETALARDMPDGEAVADLLALADVEAWARAWKP